MRHGQSRTVGVKLGEKKDTSDWQKEIPAMCVSVHLMPFDSYHLIIILMIKINHTYLKMIKNLFLNHRIIII